MELAFKKQLVQLRKAAGISQDELATKLFVSRQAISKWETGESVPDLIKVSEIAQYFGVSLDELVWGLTSQENVARSKEPVDQACVTSDEQQQQQGRNREEMGATKITNFYEFFERFWWAIFPIGGFLSWFIPRIIEAFK